MKTALCTISTESHLFKSQALLGSVMKYSDADLFCLLTDAGDVKDSSPVRYHFLNDLQSGTAKVIRKKYSGNKLRWALKPVYLKYLLESGYDQVIYVDNDIFFYASPEIAFEKLNHSSFLLTPHFYKSDPALDQNWLEANFRVGLYNAGFIGVSKRGIEMLDWWANCCLYNMKKSFWRGLFDDQKYLDLVPVLFEGVEVLKNKGFNLAGWNYKNYTLSRVENQPLEINGDRLVFIHFAALSMDEFSKKENPLHAEYETYLAALKGFQPGFEFQRSKWERRNIASFFYYLRWRLARKIEQ